MSTEMETETKAPKVSDSLDFYEHRSANVTESQIIFTDALMEKLNLYLFILFCGSVSLFGTLSNAINMTIFFKLELKDSMSICLFALSLTDFLISSIVMLCRVFPILNIACDLEGVDPMLFLYVGPEWVSDALFLCSGWILTYLSLERCVCVTFPFKVRQIFTRNRAIAAVLIIHVITASSYVPIYMTHRLEWVTENSSTAGNQTMTKSRLAVLFAFNRPEIEDVVILINSTVIPIPALILTMGSVLWMTYSLNASSKMRDSMTLRSTSETGAGKSDSRISLKTRKLVKVVLSLAILFITFSIPRILASFMNVIFPEFNLGEKEHNADIFIWQVATLSTCVNASVNIFVYLKINSSFRELFWELSSMRVSVSCKKQMKQTKNLTKTT